MKLSIFSGIISNISEIKEIQGSKLIKFQLAINEKDKKTEYYKFAAWGKLALVIKNYCNIGRKVQVVCTPNIRTVNDTETVWFEVDKIEFLDNKKNNDNNFYW
ncbi:single-stranded DNA-binding protein [Streptobacillus moniliformis]|uniref:single-stranded DNA-binding protein n=1 Tax=Streptobacillus moniliformis TaxID=34105 RepID=UPI0007E33D77|nr:single-stranded DNA-binding protein [Streptobacillus moniliformis]